MALAHPIFVPLFSAGVPGGVLKIVSGGSSTVAAEEVWTTSALTDNFTNQIFVWQGNIYFSVGSGGDLGWVEYNPRTQLFQFLHYASAFAQFLPVGDYIGWIYGSNYQRCASMRYRDNAGGATTAGNKYGWASLGDTVHVVNGTANYGTFVWAYPFSGAPALSLNPDARVFQRICAYKGAMYGLNITTGATSYLYKYSAGAWALVGAGFAVTHNADLNVVTAAVSFFEAGGKLWFITSYNTPGVADQWHRIFEVDEVAGTVTEQNALIPAAWKVAPTHLNRRIFEVIDDTGTARLIYIIVHNGATAGWDCYEFDGTNPFTLVASGGHRLGLSAGVIWDEESQGCHIVSGVDSIPSSYMTIAHKVSDLRHNALVSVDLRYQDFADTSVFPVFPQCTEKNGVGSEGKTSLASKPTGVSTLANLSDNFDDGTVNPILWEVSNIAHDEAGRDYGVCNAIARYWYYLQEAGGAICFGGTAPAPSLIAGEGIGLKSRWGINGAFTAQVTLFNLAALITNAARNLKMIVWVKTSTNNGFGIYIWKNVNVLARGFYVVPNGIPVVSAIGATNLVDGMILQIGRTAAGVFSCFLDTAGANEDVTPALAPAYAGEMQLWLGAFGQTATNWSSATPGPGFSDLVVAGAGSVGLFEGEVQHNFMWNHLLDFGANKNTSIIIHSDTN